MCKHKLGLAGDGRALVCILPDCYTGGKPFVVAGGDAAIGEPEDELVEKDNIHREAYHHIAREFYLGSSTPERMQELPRCSSCRTRTIVNIGGLIRKAFCGGCGRQLLKDGKPLS